MRSFIVLLLLVIVFLAGMLIGIEREESIHSNHISSELTVVEQSDKLDYWEVNEEAFMFDEQLLEREESEHTTQKIASFLESGVKGFYEILVEILFGISSLFI